MAQEPQVYVCYGLDFVSKLLNQLTLVLLRSLVGHDVAEDLAVGLLRAVPGHLEAVHRDLGEAEVGRRTGNALERPRRNPLRLGPLTSRVEG